MSLLFRMHKSVALLPCNPFYRDAGVPCNIICLCLDLASFSGNMCCMCAVDGHQHEHAYTALSCHLQSVDELCQRNIWRQLASESTKKACEVHTSQQLATATSSETMTQQDILLHTRTAWHASTPLWVSIARSLLAYGPQQSFEVWYSTRDLQASSTASH